MDKITIGRKGDKGFKGCVTGVKVTRAQYGGKPNTVEPIKAFVYDGKTDGFTASNVTENSKEKCGPEPKVPPIPTPRPVGCPVSPATGSPTTKDPEKQAKTVTSLRSDITNVAVRNNFNVKTLYLYCIFHIVLDSFK